MSNDLDELDITEEEARLYDRQLRLWGFQAQQRLKNAKVLVISVRNALQHEIIKNILLAGVNSVDFVGNETVEVGGDKVDLAPFLFCGRAHAGDCQEQEKVFCTERILLECADLNPRAKLKSHSIHYREFLSSLADTSDYSLVLYGGSRFDEIAELEAACIKTGTKFYAAGVFGMIGYAYNNLGKGHSYVVERTVVDKGESKTTQTTEIASYENLESAFDFKLAAGLSTRQLERKVSWQLLLVLAYLGRPQICETVEEFSDHVHSFRELHGVNERLLDDATCRQFFEDRKMEYNPVCAIMGGLVGQDIINAISHKNTPIKNVLVLDGAQLSADVFDLSQI